MAGAFCTVLAIALGAAAEPATSLSVIPQAEKSDVATMKPMGSHWIITRGAYGSGGMYVFDGDDGKMQGEVVNYGGDFAIDPAGKYFYTSETFYAHRNRGARDDVLTMWDSQSLKVAKEITLPGRMVINGRLQNLQVSSNGKYAFIYNMMPSSSVIMVELEKQAVEQTVELPGCAGVYPDAAGGFSALCSNGSLASVSFAGGKPAIQRSKPFFNAVMDPIYDNSVSDAKSGQATFLSYSGLIYQVALNAAPAPPKPWSLQEGADMKKAEAAPLAVAWYPGGSQPLAVHYADNHIYVLMHMGEYWSHVEPGTEVWMLDGATHKLIRRIALPDEMKSASIAVSQGDNPKLFAVVGGRDGASAKILVLDGVTLQKDRIIEHVGGGNLYVKS
ncbi:MAG TPA: amine dehydrogenase large subunit [Rhizomicrobium sp.]